MKKTKLLMPLAAGLTAITPFSILTACNDTNVTSVTNKSLTTGDSVAYYKFKMKNNPSDNKVIVNVINKTAKEPVVLYTDVSTAASVAEYTVKDDGTIIVPAGYYLAPSNSASSDFALTFTYKNGDKQKTETIDGLKFNYSIDYGKELSAKQYDPEVDPEDSSHWDQTANKTVGEIYTEDVLKNPNIFQDDARYSTSLRIQNDAGSSFANLTNFQSYFNDIIEEGDGLHIHMNYKLKGDHFEFTQDDASSNAGTKHIFNNFDISFSFETPNGYTIKKATSGHEAGTRKLIISDPTGHYYLDGRFSGTFTYKRGDSGTEIPVNYSGIIDNYNIFPVSNGDADTPAQMSSMFAFGIIHLTYGFQWGKAVELSIASHYAKEAPEA